jgi:serine/threonine protein kinase
MARMRMLFACIGKAILCKGPKALCSLVPFGEVVYEVAADAWERLHQAAPKVEQQLAIAAVARAGLAEARQEAEAVVEELQLEQALPAEAKVNLVSYLSQVPDSVRRSLKRPADATGRTVPPSFSLDRPEQLLTMLPARLPRFKPGDRPVGVGNWELVELLGCGGFGEVWKARHPSLAGIAPVALKFCLDPACAVVVRHEASLLDRVMQQSTHPGVVTLRQAYLESDPVCLEYEYIAGGDLAGAINAWHGRGRGGERMPLRQINRVMLQLAEIIAFAHRLNPPIVHRDLKPANVLLSVGNALRGVPAPVGNALRGVPEESGTPRRAFPTDVTLKVTDFGIGGVAATRSLSVRGGQVLPTSLRGAHTPFYASPQQVKGEPPDPRDDVHALGVIWYQMLTGELSTSLPPDWSTVLKDLGQLLPLIDLMAECVTSRLDKRLKDAGVLADRLRNELEAEDLPEALPLDEPPPEVEPVRPRAGKRAATERKRPARETILEAQPTEAPPHRRPRRKPARSDNQMRRFSAPGLRLSELRLDLERWLIGQGFNVQDLLTEDGATLIQMEQKSTWRKLTGMSSALNIILDHRDDELIVEIGAGHWMDKAAVGAVSLFVLWPLAVTAAIGAWSQMKLPEQIFTRIEEQLNRNRRGSEEAGRSGLSTDAIARLRELAALREQGILTDEEFQAEKKRLLGKAGPK